MAYSMGSFQTATNIPVPDTTQHNRFTTSRQRMGIGRIVVDQGEQGG
jgi:hypothetical protein